PALNPLRFAAAREKALEFDIARRDRLKRAEAEGLDPQLAAQRPDPSTPGKQPVAGALDMEQDFGWHLAGIAFRCRLARGKGRNGPAPLQRSSSRWSVETAQL